MAKAPEQKTLSISSIEALEGIRIRTRTNPAAVTDYAEQIRNGINLGPIEVVASKHDGDDSPVNIVGDGYHRLEAHKALDREKIACLVHQSRGSFEKDKAHALEIALERNCRHGLQMSSADKVRAVKLALENLHKMSDTALSKLCGTSPKFVAEVRKGKTDKPTGKKKVSVKKHDRAAPSVTAPKDDPLQDRIDTMKAWIKRGEIDLSVIANNIDTKVEKLLLVSKNGKQSVKVRSGQDEKTYPGCTLAREEGFVVIETE